MKRFFESLALFIIVILLFISPLITTAFSSQSFAESDLSSLQSLQAGNSYKANIFIRGPVKGSGGGRINITLSITELSDVSKLGSVLVMLPDLHGNEGFSAFRLSSSELTTPGGKRWSGAIAERNGKYFINLKAKTAEDYLGSNETVSISFSATIPAAGYTGSYEFKTRAWTDNSSRDSMRTSSETGQPENLNLLAAGYSDPYIYVELPAVTGSNSYYSSSERVKGLTAELQGEGKGFQTTVFRTSDSVSFLTRLRLPAMHSFTTTYYQPSAGDNWNARLVAENRQVDLLQGYTAGWQSYFHRVISPGRKEVFNSLTALLKAQDELKDHNLSGLSETELKKIAHREGISYYQTVVTPFTEQVWFAGVSLDPGATGVLIKRINSSYGTTDYMFNDKNELWPARSGYRGPAHGFGFVRDGDGYRVERGIDYPGSFVDIKQVADASRGRVVRYIDVSSPYSNAFLTEDMLVSGSGRVDEIINSVDIKPGAFLDWPGSASFSDDWDIWFAPDKTLYSNAFDSPFIQGDPQGSGTSTAVLPPDETSDAMAAGESGHKETAPTDDREQTVIVPPGSSQVALAEEEPADQIEGGGTLLHDAAVISQKLDYTAIAVFTVISLLILATVTAIVVILIKNR